MATRRIIPVLLFLGLLMFICYTPQAKADLGEVKIGVNTLNVRSGPGLEYEQIEQVHFGEKYAYLEERDSWYKISLPSGKEGWIAAWLVEVEEKTTKQVKVNVETLNMRAKPGLDADIIGKLSKDTVLDVVAEQNDWLQINYQGQQGWVANWLVTSLHPLPNTETSPTTEQSQKITVLNNGTNLREGPGTNFPVIGRANQGDSFQVLKTEGDWFQIALSNGKTAYIAGWIVSVEGADPVLKNSIDTYLQGKKIVIDPGHGGKDDGATGSHFNTPEKVVNLQFALLLKQKLEAVGAKVVLTRDADYFIPLEQRVKISINEWADAFISIHHNTHPNANTNGTITYYYSNEDRRLASFIQTQVVKYGGLANLNARHGNYFVLRENPRPSVLLELGFLSNYHDEATIRTLQFQESAADGVIYGLAQYFQEKMF